MEGQRTTTATTAVVFPLKPFTYLFSPFSHAQGKGKKEKSNHDDECGHGQEKGRPSTYVEGNNQNTTRRTRC